MLCNEFCLFYTLNSFERSVELNFDRIRLQSAQPDPIDIQRQQESRRRAIARKRAKQQLRPKSPEPVEGRKHIDVQTELYLEELRFVTVVFVKLGSSLTQD